MTNNLVGLGTWTTTNVRRQRMPDNHQLVKCPDCGGMGAFPMGGHRMVLNDLEFLDGECPWCSIGLMVAVRHGKIIDVETFGTEPSEAEAGAEAMMRLTQKHL
jgi:hypothetical protein